MKLCFVVQELSVFSWLSKKCRTLLIGYDSGRKTRTSSRTKGDNFAPILSPYLEHTACGIICIAKKEKHRNQLPDHRLPHLLIIYYSCIAYLSESKYEGD